MNKFDDTLVVEFTSSKVPGESIIRIYGDIMKGLRFGERRPDMCKIVHVGKDFVKDEYFDEFYSDVVNCMAGGCDLDAAMYDLDDMINRYMFINKIGGVKWQSKK